MNTSRASLFLAACLILPSACAKPPQAAPSAPLRAMTQAEIDDFLAKAEAADKIKDKLQRCLAFPDVPGNRWPKGLAAAHCELEYGPRITRDRVAAMLGQGQLAELDALFAADLDKHFSQAAFSEALHGDFDAFDASDEADRLTQDWLAKAPNSAYALTARAAHLREKAQQSRGEGWASETSEAGMQGMHRNAELAIDHYQRALKIEPRMLPAYVGLIAMGDMSGRDDLVQWAVKEGNKIDPACTRMRGFQMTSLSPRWGGSEQQMQALSAEVAPDLARRPLLALVTIWPPVDRADTLLRQEEYAAVAETLAPVLPQTTHPKPYRDMAVSLIAQDQEADTGRALVYLLEAARYEEKCCAGVQAQRGRLLLEWYKRPAWAAIYLQRAVEAAPGYSYAHYLLASAYVATGRRPYAEMEYLLAMDDPQLRQRALFDLISAMTAANERDKARTYAAQAVREYYDDPLTWRLYTTTVPNGGMDSAADLRELIEIYEEYLAAAETQPSLAADLPRVKAELERLRQTLPTMKP